MTDRRERALDAAVRYHFEVRAAARAAVTGAAVPNPVTMSDRARRIVRQQYEGLVDAILAGVDGAPPPPVEAAVAVSRASNDQEAST